MNPARLTTDQIKKLVYGIESLNQEQRGLITELLERLAGGHDGHVYPLDLQKELWRLRDAHQLSDIDVKAVTRAVFEA